jgi:hypothetical protein
VTERARAIYFIIDSEGRPIPSATVTVRDPGTTDPIAATIYANDDTDPSTLANPFTAGADGRVEFYLTSPDRVDLFIQKAGYSSQTVPVDVQFSTLLAPHSITGSEHTASGLTTGEVLKANSATTFGFGQVPTAGIVDGSITLAKLANIATDRLIGRDTAATGVPEALTVGGGLEFTGSGGIQHSAHTGDVTSSAGNAALTIANDAVTHAKYQNIATDRLLGRDTAGTGDPEALTVSGGIEFTGSGGIQTSAFTGDVTKTAGGTALTIANDAVTNAMIRNSVGLSVLGRSANTTGDPADIAGTDGQVLRVSGTTLGFGTVAKAGLPSAVAYEDEANSFSASQTISTGQLIVSTTGSSGGLLIGGDTNLYRSAADTLKTDDKLIVGGATSQFGLGLTFSTFAAENAQLRGNYIDATDRLYDTAQPSWNVSIGSGNDTFKIYRAPATAGSPAYAALLTIDSGGIMYFGSALDTNLYRSVADVLKTDDTFRSAVALGTGHVAAATPTGGSSGDIKIGNGKIWVNDAGTWKSAAIA